MSIQIASIFVPKNGNTYALLEDTYFLGGFRVVDNTAARDTVDQTTRKAGMLVLTADTGLIYKLGADLTAWTELSLQGPRGYVGPAGPAGEQGPVGPTGATGATGPQGERGLQGVTGAKGDAGDVGPTGPQGAKGDKGDQGVQGLTGATGPAGATGAQGPKGDAGDKGDTGLQGLVGPVGPTGSQGLTGAKGDTGSDGPVGPTGPQGERGLQGDTGLQGPAGADGAQGLKGDKGDQGDQGPKGDKGDQGEQGPAGGQGPVGPTGPAGADGAQGLKGDKGDQGDTGLKGDTGNVGPVGPTGPQGEKGNQGDPGTSLNYRGEYVASATYVIGDYVSSPNNDGIVIPWLSTSANTGVEPKTNPATWTPMAVIGAKGDVGATGAKGDKGDQGASSTWHVGVGVPATSTGVDGDKYLNKTNGDIYDKVAGAWSVTANIRGPAGADYDPMTTVLALPYDISVFIFGGMDEASEAVSSFIAPRIISLKSGLEGAQARAKTPPANAVTYNLVVNGETKGTLTFAQGSTTGTFAWPQDLNLQVGDLFQIVTPATVESSIKDVSICIVGAALAPNTTMIP